MPLKVSYALSIHKSQGMTIDALEIDLGENIFTCGQAYTALSRAKSLKSIKIIDVSKDSFKINPYVKKFYYNIRL
jgi:ATP-dependent DNA helicase PIF1